MRWHWWQNTTKQKSNKQTKITCRKLNQWQHITGVTSSQDEMLELKKKSYKGAKEEKEKTLNKEKPTGRRAASTGEYKRTHTDERDIHWLVNNNQYRCLSSFSPHKLNSNHEESKLNIHKGKCRTPDIDLFEAHTTPQSYTLMSKDYKLLKINFLNV